MKKLILLSALLFSGIIVNAQATANVQQSEQQSQAAASKATKQTADLEQALTLTAAQKEKVYAISFAKNKAISEAASNKATFEAEKKRIKEEREKEIFNVLTAEQQTKFRALKAERTKK
jgi:hypothetical protein